MNYIVSVFALIILIAANTAYAEGKTKEVCKDKVDKAGKVVKGKDGKPMQVCKKIKIHNRVDGTRVPEKAPKK